MGSVIIRFSDYGFSPSLSTVTHHRNTMNTHHRNNKPYETHEL